MFRPDNKSDTKGRYATLVILTISYLIVRLVILFSAIDKVHIEEELYRGNIAKELIGGPILPFFDYQITEWEGGSLVQGLLAVPFFLLFGESLFSLKLAGLFFSSGIFILWYLFLDRFFQRKTAILASLLFILSPPLCTAVSMAAEGSHFQSGFFTILAIFIFCRIFFEKAHKYLFMLLGLVSGFGLFFDYIFSVTLFTLLLFWFIFDKKFIFSRGFFIFSLFFLLGFSPWIYYNLTHNFEGFIVNDKPLLYWFTSNSFSGSLMRFKNLITGGMARSFNFQDIGILSRRLQSAAYYLIFAFSISGLFFMNRKCIRKFRMLAKEISPEMLIIVFPVIFSLVFSFSGFKFYFIDKKIQPAYAGYRFLFPLYPFVFAIIALFLERIKRRKGFFLAAHLNAGIITILVCLGLISNFNLVSRDNLGKGFTYKIYRGYNYFDLGRLFSWRFRDNVETAVELTKKMDRRFQRYCYEGMGWGIRGSYRYPYEMSVKNYIRHIANKLDKEYHPYAYERLGRVIGYDNKIAQESREVLDGNYKPYFYRGLGAETGKNLAIDRYQRLAEEIHAKYQPYFHEGMGIELFEILTDDTEVFLDFTRRIDKRLIPALYKGLSEGKEYYQFNYDRFGFGIGRVGYDIEKWNKIINNIPDEYRPYCYQRLGIEIGWRFIHDIKRYLKFLEQADKKYSPSLYQGLGTGIGWRFGYDLAACHKLIQRIDPQYRAYAYAGLETGLARRQGYQRDGWERP